MKSTEFGGFVCDGCGNPFTIEQAECKSIHVNGTISLNNTSEYIDNGDFHNITCFKRAVTRVLTLKDYF